jgi:hypothetical protein
MEKIQQFVVDGMLYSMQCAYHPEEIVWTADIEPYEWNTESEMRIDMLIHFLAADDIDRKLFESWDCRSEFIKNYEDYQSWLHNDDHEYDPNKNI